MITEDKRFLDLDHVCDQILNSDDRNMFNEAIRCYQTGSHRAAIILSWCVTADCLYRRIDEIATEGDGTAQHARIALQRVAGQSCYEENLIVEGKRCELFDDYEEKCLRFARDVRSKCAHPTGVIPSAEAVRNILHICSQTVLCREGYRGMAFIKNFVQDKLDDKHLYSKKNEIAKTSKYYFSKVPQRIWPQFAACFSDTIGESHSSHWKTNALLFFKELINCASNDLPIKISSKFQPIESVDPELFSILVGLDERDNIWESQVREQAKARLREKLTTGRIKPAIFKSYSNLCLHDEFDDEDTELFQNRLFVLSEPLSTHNAIQEKRFNELIDIILNNLQDETLKPNTYKALLNLISTKLFSQKSEKINLIIDDFIQNDWKEDDLRQIFQQCTDWELALKISLLKKTEEYLLECSEDNAEDILLVFEIVNSVIEIDPTIIPIQFEESIQKILKNQIQLNWFEEKGEAFSLFCGQIELLTTRYGSYFSEIELPTELKPSF